MTTQQVEAYADSVGGRVAQLREWRGLSQVGLAHLSGVSRSSIANIETGAQRASWGIIGDLARALDVSMRVLDGADPMPDVPRITVQAIHRVMCPEHGLVVEVDTPEDAEIVRQRHVDSHIRQAGGVDR